MTIRIDDGDPVVMTRPGVGDIYGSGSSVPADNALGWAHGAAFLKTNGTSATDAFYINVGTKAAANFDSITDLTDASFAADTISEFTAAHGVTIDGVNLKDGGINLEDGTSITWTANTGGTIAWGTSAVLAFVTGANELDITFASATDFAFTANTFTAVAGSTIATDTIAETTAAAGVTVDGVLLKDAGIVATGTLQLGGTDKATVKGIYTSGTIAVAVPSIANDAAENVDSVTVDISALTFAAAVGDSVIANPLAALPTDCVLLGAYVSATDQVTVTFGSKEGGGGVTGASVNFSFLIFDLT